MARNLQLNAKVLPGIVGALALALIAVPIFAPNAAISDSSVVSGETAPGDSTATPPTASSPSASPTSSGQESDASASPEPVVDEAAAETALLNALSAYETQLMTAGGVVGSFISADSQEMTLSLKANDDFRAVTTNANAPEWLYIDPVLYARLGPRELAAQKEALTAIGKPDAVWTDAAMNSEEQGVFLSAGNIANAVADLLPIMTKLRLAEGPDGTTVVQGVIDITGDLGLNADAYNLKPTDDSTTSTSGTLASVVFTIDPSGVLQGYLVQPPGSAQPVSLLLTEFTAVEIKRPSSERVITIEDLAPIVDDSTAVPAPSATP